MADDLVALRRAILSVSDKNGLLALALGLSQRGVELVSTGGTRRALIEGGLSVADVSDLTGMAEMMDGRVKTLHPVIHGGLLARRGQATHEAAMVDHAIRPIDLAVIDLYPFEATLARGAAYDDIVENIDIGGPAMIRAAAKNHDHVVVLTDIGDYPALLAEMDAHHGGTRLAFRKEMAAKAFARTAHYDARIGEWMHAVLGVAEPSRRVFGGPLIQKLRYGENPHQQAGFYRTGEVRAGVASAIQLHGKELSYNNLNDTDAAFECVAEFDAASTAAIVIVKHANPCGVAQGATLAEAYQRALACDPVSAFGGIIAANRPLDGAAASAMIKIFTEVIIAPGADEEARRIIATRKDLRLLITDALPDPAAAGTSFKSVAGGMLVQTRDHLSAQADYLKVVTRRAPTISETIDLVFAARVAKHVKSNAIVYAKDGATVGIGAGQMSRVDSALSAVRKARDAVSAAGDEALSTRGSVAASDAFFPFADGLDVLIQAGVTAVIQPGGSIRDKDVIAAADAAGLAMVFTGTRHFRH